MFKELLSSDGTRKLIFDEGYVSVIIPINRGYTTICVSSQIGCPIRCSFCHTGAFVRNLSSKEIFDQVVVATNLINKNPHAVVFMGMGEPMLNFENVSKAIELIHNHFSLSYKKITVSTSGVNLDKLVDVPYNVALSFHSANQNMRNKLIPSSVSISKLMDFVIAYSKKNKFGVLLEYALIKDVNDSDDDLKLLLGLPWPKNTNFNLIEFNDTQIFKKSNRLKEFKESIINAGFKCFIRMSRGEDIDAACGMLDYS